MLITVDCLRADHVGFEGYKGGTTPFLDSLAAESSVFANAIVSGAPTYYSFPGIMASRPPLAFGRDLIGVMPGEPTLAVILKEAGFKTAAFLAGNPYLSPRFGYHEGFDTFRDSLDAEIAFGPVQPPQNGMRTRLNRTLEKVCRQFGPLGNAYDELYFQYCQRIAAAAGSLDSLRRYPAADALVEQAMAWIQSVEDSPFFLWLHLMDPHSPYYPKASALEQMGQSVTPERARYVNASWMREELSDRRLAKYRNEIVALYDAGVRWVDAQVERLVNQLRGQGKWQECVFALTADHGEELLDHGGRYHPPSKVTEELIRVPLLVHSPEGRGRRVHSVFSLIDLAPTLLDSLAEPMAEAFHGSSRWNAICEDRDWEASAIVECVANCSNPFHSEGRIGGRILAMRGRRFKVVLDLANSHEQFFDLDSDPGENNPLPAAAYSDVRRHFLERAREHLARSAEGTRRLDGRLSGRLRELRQFLSETSEKISA